MNFILSRRLVTAIVVVALACSLPWSGQAFAKPAHRLEAPAPAQPTAEVTGTTLSFEKNEGQFDGRARFAVRLGSETAFVTDTRIVFPTSTGSSIGLSVDGASETARATGEQPLAAISNYLLGDDPADWHTNVANFAQVRCRGVLPGVDLVVYGNNGQLEFDFVVAPGASAESIRLRFDGAERIELKNDGSIRVSSGGDVLTQRAPVFYQEAYGQRIPVAGRYRMLGPTTVGLDVGAYDHSLPLVVDPVVTYATYLGGNNSDEQATGIAVDTLGNAYVTGYTQSTGFPTTPGAFQTNQPGKDVFVTKFNSSGSGIIFSTYLGGSDHDAPEEIAIDSFGEAVVAGFTLSPNFPQANGLAAPGDSDNAFLTRLNASGTGLVYSTYLGGVGHDGAFGLAVDAARNAYVVGTTESLNFPTTLGAFQTVKPSSDLPDGFVTKIDTTAVGSASLVYSTFLGAAGNDQSSAVAVSAAGEAYVFGSAFFGFPTTPTAFQQFSPGGTSNATLTRLNASGSGLVYSSYIGGNFFEQADDLAIDGNGNAYVVGMTASTNFPTTAGVFQPVDPTGDVNADAFVAKLDTNASGAASLVFSTYLGGDGVERARTVALLPTGDTVVAGWAENSTTFPLKDSLHGLVSPGFSGFVTMVNRTGTGLLYSTTLGGSQNCIVNAVALGPDNDAYIAGATNSADFPVTPGAYQTLIHGGADALVGRISLPSDSPAIYDPSTGTFFMKNTSGPGPADLVFSFGAGGLGFIPLAGDWDGNGVDTPGLYDPSTSAFFLKNSNAPGPADIVVVFGASGLGFAPVVGDWNGDGTDTLGLYQSASGTFFLKNANTPGPADAAFSFGAGGLGFTAIAGDWDGDGFDTIGLYDSASGTFFLRNANTGGPADLAIAFGPGGAGVVPVAGDWNHDAATTIGVSIGASGAWFLRNVNAGGGADLTFSYGPPGPFVPLAGNWDGR